MENVLNITQDEMNTVIDNEPQMPSSKIKLRSMSLANSKKHIKNVPHFSRKQLKDNDKEIVKEKEDSIVSFSTATKVEGNEEKSSVLTSVQNKIIPFPSMKLEMVSGSAKPINVKEDKEKNIQNHATALVMEAIEKEKTQEQSTIVSEHPDTTANETVVNHDNIVSENVSDTNNSLPSTDSNVSVEEKTIVNIDDYIAKLGNETESIKNIKEQARLAQEEADASDLNLNKISVEASELEKQEAEAKKRDLELDKLLVAAYESQSNTLVNARKDYEDTIKSANIRRQENENKILQFQAKMDSSRSNITNFNESIARKQAILDALQNTNASGNVAVSEISNEEEKVKKIA